MQDAGDSAEERHIFSREERLFHACSSRASGWTFFLDLSNLHISIHDFMNDGNSLQNGYLVTFKYKTPGHTISRNHDIVQSLAGM